MRSAVRLLIGAVLVVVAASVAIGLASPDGTVRGTVPAAPTATVTSAAPSATPATTPAGAGDTDERERRRGPDRAPASVAGTWPGVPDRMVADDGSVDWCRGVRTSGDTEAVRVFGRAAVDDAACAAVRFVFEHRYSRLSLPRRTYRAADFDDVAASLSPRTVADVYRPRVDRFVTDPASDTAGEQLGLVLFTGRSTPAGAKHASAGAGHVFFGPTFSRRGYAGRAAWVEPTWSTVAVRVDRAAATPRLETRLTASAAMPVWSTTARRDAMMIVPTRATFVLRQASGSATDAPWRIDGWTISRGRVSYAALSTDR